MFRMQRTLALCVIALVLTQTTVAFAQLNRVPPADVTSPSEDVFGDAGVGIPKLDTSLIRAEDKAKFLFDNILDSSVGTDPTKLTKAAMRLS